MARMQSVKNYMTEKQRLCIANAYLVSSLKYGAPFLAGEKQSVKHKYHLATMMVARWIKNNYCFKVSCHKICRSLNWNIPSQQIAKEAAKFAHKIYFSRRPAQILRQIRMPRTRSKAKLSIKYKKKHEKYDHNLIVQSLKTYNNIPDELKDLPPKKFGEMIQNFWIKTED